MTSLVERLRRRVNKPDGTKRRPSPRELEAADTIEALCEALGIARDYVKNVADAEGYAFNIRDLKQVDDALERAKS